MSSDEEEYDYSDELGDNDYEDYDYDDDMSSDYGEAAAATADYSASPLKRVSSYRVVKISEVAAMMKEVSVARVRKNILLKAVTTSLFLKAYKSCLHVVWQLVDDCAETLEFTPEESHIHLCYYKWNIRKLQEDWFDRQSKVQIAMKVIV